MVGLAAVYNLDQQGERVLESVQFISSFVTEILAASCREDFPCTAGFSCQTMISPSVLRGAELVRLECWAAWADSVDYKMAKAAVGTSHFEERVEWAIADLLSD